MASDNQLNYSVNKLSKYTRLDISQGDFRQFLKDAPSTNTLRSSSVVMGWITVIPPRLALIGLECLVLT